MRMFWACTHAMLRISELPLFADMGFEVIPEEVTPVVMNYLEGMKYDDPDLPINRQWRDRCTLPENIINALARSRIWERNGDVSAQEADLFNQAIDVIYIPTRLDLAVKVSKWFKGVVIYRYFGDLHEGRDYLANIPHSERSALKNIVFLPIFKSLLADPVAKYFDKTFVLHNYLDSNVVPRSWSGYQLDAEAVVVLGSVHLFPPFEEILRELIPLAKKIPIKLLGKNVYSKLPTDIRDAFNVKTDLGRTEFFDEFFTSQFLIYPHARRNHSHNVPIEAIYGGMPIVFRTETPTFVENTHPISSRIVPSSIGATRTMQGLRSFAQRVYNNQVELTKLTTVQSRLTSPYSIENVHNEAAKLTNFIQSIVPDRKEKFDSTVSTLFSGIAPREVFFCAKTLVKDEASFSALNILHGSILTSAKAVGYNGQELNVLKVNPFPGFTEILLGNVLGDEDALFDPSVSHDIEVEFYSSGFGLMEAYADIFIDGNVVRHESQRLCVEGSQITKHSVTFSLAASDAFKVLLCAKVKGECEVFIGDISHRFGKKTGAMEASIDPDIAVIDPNFSDTEFIAAANIFAAPNCTKIVVI